MMQQYLVFLPGQCRECFKKITIGRELSEVMYTPIKENLGNEIST